MSHFVVMPPTRTHGYRVFAIPNIFLHKTECNQIIRYFDVDQRKWVSTEKPLPCPRADKVVRLTDTKIAMCGYKGDSGTQTACALFDVDTYELTELPDMTIHRENFGTIHYRGTIVVIGGYTRTVDIVKMCEQYTPGAVAWEPMGEIPAPARNVRASGAWAVVVEDKIYAICGLIDPNLFMYDGTVWHEIALNRNFNDVFQCFLINYKGKPAALCRFGQIQILDTETYVWRTLDDVATPAYRAMPALKLYTF